MPPRLTYITAVVLEALDSGYRYGFDIMDRSGLPDGTIYPALRRLEAAGWVTSDWEESEKAHQRGRPPRRYYRLTKEGVAALARARERYPVLPVLKGLEA